MGELVHSDVHMNAEEDAQCRFATCYENGTWQEALALYLVSKPNLLAIRDFFSCKEFGGGFGLCQIPV